MDYSFELHCKVLRQDQDEGVSEEKGPSDGAASIHLNTDYQSGADHLFPSHPQGMWSPWTCACRTMQRFCTDLVSLATMRPFRHTHGSGFARGGDTSGDMIVLHNRAISSRGPHRIQVSHAQITQTLKSSPFLQGCSPQIFELICSQIVPA